MTPPPMTRRSLASSLGGGVNGTQLLGVGDRLAAKRAVPPRRVGAHAPERRRVGVDGDGEPVAVVAHPMHVGRVEVERLTRRVRDLPRRPAEDHALLDDLPVHDRDRPARDVVVVEARVTAAGPGDDPHIDMVVAPELLEVALGASLVHQPAPRVRLRRDAGDELSQLPAVEVAVTSPVGGERAHAGTSAATAPSSRSGLRSRSAVSTASPIARGRASTTGRSEPKTSRSTPISRTIMSTARSP